MQIIQHGTGEPVVLIPGIQGKWEYLRPAIDRLSLSYRVITFSLCGEPSSGLPFASARGLDSDVSQVADVLDELGIERATICGISFGGLIALRFAAAHPHRTRALVLASTPGPGWQLRRRHAVYARVPWMFGPLFLLEVPRRLRRELAAAFPDWRARRQFVQSQLRTIAIAPVSLTRIAARALMISAADLVGAAATIGAPTLVVTGERGLDHVSPVEASLDYVKLIRGARGVVLEHTGHLGSITRPEAFAAALREFLAALDCGGYRSSADLRAHRRGVQRDGRNDAA